MEYIIILASAIIIDMALGDPPNAFHPVAWLGKVISYLVRGGTGLPPVAQFIYGIVLVLITLVLFVVPVYFVLVYLQSISFLAYVMVGGLLFKLTFSVTGLRRAALKIRTPLQEQRLAEARLELRALVSRDTTNFSEGQVVSATVESLAENNCDSFVAPLFYFLLFGIPGAMAYRVINTFDAMIGYHGRWEFLGKFAARADDVVNYIPARISALMIVMAAGISNNSMSVAWRIMVRDHNKTPSPNAGWTISAVAGALGVRLEKRGCYELGDNHFPLSLDTIDASCRIVITAVVVWGLVAIITEVIRFVAS